MVKYDCVLWEPSGFGLFLDAPAWSVSLAAFYYLVPNVAPEIVVSRPHLIKERR